MITEDLLFEAKQLFGNEAAIVAFLRNSMQGHNPKLTNIEMLLDSNYEYVERKEKELDEFKKRVRLLHNNIRKMCSDEFLKESFKIEARCITYMHTNMSKNVDKHPNGIEMNVIYNEDMYIDPRSNFQERLNKITNKHLGQLLDLETKTSLDLSLNTLLNEILGEGYLFLKNQLPSIPDGFIILHGDPLFYHYDYI
jgi:hypothetical protein